jgi:hypothetical protein
MATKKTKPTAKPSKKTASKKSASPKKVVAKKASPKKVATKKIVTKRTPNKVVAKKPTPKKTVSKKEAPTKKLAVKKVSPKKSPAKTKAEKALEAIDALAGMAKSSEDVKPSPVSTGSSSPAPKETEYSVELEAFRKTAISRRWLRANLIQLAQESFDEVEVEILNPKQIAFVIDGKKVPKEGHFSVV